MEHQRHGDVASFPVAGESISGFFNLRRGDIGEASEGLGRVA